METVLVLSVFGYNYAQSQAAGAILKDLDGIRLSAESNGQKAGTLNLFADHAMPEIGIDISGN